jgi:hypothetical protein
MPGDTLPVAERTAGNKSAGEMAPMVDIPETSKQSKPLQGPDCAAFHDKFASVHRRRRMPSASLA